MSVIYGESSVYRLDKKGHKTEVKNYWKLTKKKGVVLFTATMMVVGTNQSDSRICKRRFSWKSATINGSIHILGIYNTKKYVVQWKFNEAQKK